MILDLDEFFQEFNHHTYCIIKTNDDLPSYKKGSDLDIFCYDIDQMATIILNVGNQYINQGLEIVISNMKGQRYIDFIHINTDVIEFRFDLYSALPSYKNILIKPAFFENVLENKIQIDIHDKSSIYVPAPIDDKILRYIEYQEWYGQRPDKIKHINYILESNESTINNFLEKLHHYTSLPLADSTYPIQKDNLKSIKIFIRKILSKLPTKLKILIKKFI